MKETSYLLQRQSKVAPVLVTSGSTCLAALGRALSMIVQKTETALLAACTGPAIGRANAGSATTESDRLSICSDREAQREPIPLCSPKLLYCYNGIIWNLHRQVLQQWRRLLHAQLAGWQNSSASRAAPTRHAPGLQQPILDRRLDFSVLRVFSAISLSMQPSYPKGSAGLGHYLF